MSEPPTNEARWGAGRVAFLANKDALQDKVDAGYSLRSIYAEFGDRLSISYAQFTRYVNQFLRSKDLADGHQDSGSGNAGDPTLPFNEGPPRSGAEVGEAGAAPVKNETAENRGASGLGGGGSSGSEPRADAGSTDDNAGAPEPGGSAAGGGEPATERKRPGRGAFHYDPTQKRNDLY